MANVTPKASASVVADLAVDTINTDAQGTPAAGSAAVNAAGNRKIVHITLVADGVTVTPEGIYTALDTQYAVVQGEKDMMSRNCYIFNIGPA